MKRGDMAIYIGKIKITLTTPGSMFDFLELFREYEILGTSLPYYYLISYDGIHRLWYPIENFSNKFSKTFLSDKYDLR